MADRTSELVDAVKFQLLDWPQLTNLIDLRVDEVLRRRKAGLRNWLLVFIPIVAVALGWLFSEMSRDRGVPQPLTTAMDSPNGEAELKEPTEFEGAASRNEEEEGVDQLFALRLANLNLNVLRIDTADGFSNDDAVAIIDEIEALLREFPDREAELESPIETTIKNFSYAARYDYVRGLSMIAPERMLSRPSFVTMLTNIFGLRLLDDPHAPGSWTDDDGLAREDYAEYRKYASRAPLVGYPELLLLYEMLLAHVEDRPGEEVAVLIDQNQELTPADLDNYVHILASLAGEHAPRLARIRASEFLCRYQSTNVPLLTAATQAGLDCPGLAPTVDRTYQEG